MGTHLNVHIKKIAKELTSTTKEEDFQIVLERFHGQQALDAQLEAHAELHWATFSQQIFGGSQSPICGK